MNNNLKKCNKECKYCENIRLLKVTCNLDCRYIKTQDMRNFIIRFGISDSYNRVQFEFSKSFLENTFIYKNLENVIDKYK